MLEIGCGTGRVSRIFAKDYYVTGVDISKNMLEKALIKAKEEQWNFRGINADARNLPFHDNEFDIVYTVHVLHLIKDWKKVIREALRCSNNKYVDVDLSRKIFSTDLLKNYWKYLQELGINEKYYTNNKLGAQNDDEINSYMQSLGFSSFKKEFSIKSSINKEILIEIVKSKSFSGQRFLADEFHFKTMQYLEENDYFIPKEQKVIELDEQAMINFYYLSN